MNIPNVKMTISRSNAQQGLKKDNWIWGSPKILYAENALNLNNQVKSAGQSFPRWAAGAAERFREWRARAKFSISIVRGQRIFLQLRRSVGPPPENIWNFDALRRNFRPFMACIIWNIQGGLLSYASYAHVYFEIDKARWTFRSVVHKKIWRLLKKVGAIAPQPQWCAAHGQPTCITTLEFLRIARIRFHYLCLNPFKNESVSARNRSL